MPRQQAPTKNDGADSDKDALLAARLGWTTLRLIALLFALTGIASLIGCDAQAQRDTTNPATIDWQSLEFKCSHQAELLPKPDAQAEEWYRQANDLRQAGHKSGNQDYSEQSFALTLKAAERGHVKAMNNLVRAYIDGDGVEIDEAKGVEWAEKLIKRNVGLGYYHMGTFLQRGIGVQEDRNMALTYFRKGADLGNAQSQLVTGDNLRKAVAQSAPGERDRGFSIARAMFECALEQGSADAGYALARQYIGYEKKPREALMPYQAAARLGHDQSLFDLWTAFKEGDGVDKDKFRAACYERLWRDRSEGKAEKLLDIDRVCPLPPGQVRGD
ncbi:tetratricopeptide repeat protein [Lysobacter sp. CA199]|uniref:tetratricopeptide repeat protein n=1 Tax=Lysobacter sp. CA199 TaxID=3455608 RepID=UPI003F8D2FA4